MLMLAIRVSMLSSFDIVQAGLSTRSASPSIDHILPATEANMKFLLLSVFLCLAVCFMATSAAPREEAIPEGFEGPGSESVNPSDDQSFLLKLKLLKKLLFLG
ncbi:LOW QUALITY PROTEIN: uncharacterized protein LOC6544040 [Drosophila erecta]|nr:LOW QUALITY PROTEIN: uncharacterized protein LOC6544040 [Drosophila erecta]